MTRVHPLLKALAAALLLSLLAAAAVHWLYRPPSAEDVASYQRQLELLTKVRRGVADVATSRKRVELQINQLEQQAAKLTDQAQKAGAE